MKCNRFICTGKLVFAALVLAGVFLHHAIRARADDITIGVLTALSGKTALLGRQLELGARLAAQIGGNAGQPVRIEVLDTGCKAKPATKAANQMAKLKVQIVVGPLCSEAFYAALDVLSPKKIPVIAPYARVSRLAQGRKKDGWLAYTLSSGPDEEISNIAGILLKRWRGKPYAIADDGSVYGRGLADGLRTLADLSGQRPVGQANFRPLQSNQISLLRRLSKSGIEALFVGGGAEDIAQIARDVQKLKLPIEIAGGESLIMLPHIDSADSVPAGILAVFPLAPELLPEAADLVSRLRSENVEPQGALIPGYAMTQIAIEAALSGQLELEGRTFQSVMGPVTFNRDGRASAFSHRLHVWQGGNMKPIGGS